MSIDVIAETRISRPRERVARFATNPDNDPIWIGGVQEARLLDQPPLAVGTRVARTAKFLGRRIEYVNEVTEYDPAALVRMRSFKGPFPMKITYEFEDADGGTLARLRVEGEASGFFKLASPLPPLLSRAVKGSVTRDLATLKALLESDREGP